MSWTRDAIAAFMLDDPKMDVDPERASKRAAQAMKRVFALASKRKPSKFATHGGSGAGGKEKAAYDLERLERVVGEPAGYSWADVKYGDQFACVRGDTILDLALRNAKSPILVACLREMRAPAKNKRLLDEWQRECLERVEAYGTFEGSLLFVPPHLRRLLENLRATAIPSKQMKNSRGEEERRRGGVGAAASTGTAVVGSATATRVMTTAMTTTGTGEEKEKEEGGGSVNEAKEWEMELRHLQRGHELWQKRHFVFFPEDNSLEVLTPLVPGLTKPEFKMSPEFALLTYAEAELEAHASRSKQEAASAAAAAAAHPGGAAACAGGGVGRASLLPARGSVAATPTTTAVAATRAPAPTPATRGGCQGLSGGAAGSGGGLRAGSAGEESKSDGDGVAIVEGGPVDDDDSGDDSGDEEGSNGSGGGGGGDRLGVPPQLFLFEVSFLPSGGGGDQSGSGSGVRKPPLLLAAPSANGRESWIRAINSNKRNVPRGPIPPPPFQPILSTQVHTG